MYANRNNSANYGSLLQIERLMSDRERLGRAEELSFCHSRGTKSGKQRALSAKIKL